MRAFSKSEINELLSVKLKDWAFDGSCLTRNFRFENFVKAFSFMTSIAFEAEKMDHHPEWTNVYNSVTIRLNTHDAKGITQLDADLAGSIDEIFKSYKSV